MNKNKIITLFKALDKILKEKNIKGEIGIVGGAAMVLGFNARSATKDVDAVFVSSEEIRKAAKQVAKKYHMPSDWLNDAVKGFMPGEPVQKNPVLILENLKVWIPPAQYLLAMKAISARLDTMDAQDVKTLCKYLKLIKPEQVLKIIEKFYPKRQIPAKTVFFIEELFES